MMISTIFNTFPLYTRGMPGASSAPAAAAGGGSMDGLNIMLIVGLALVITFLARYLSTRKRKK